MNVIEDLLTGDRRGEPVRKAKERCRHGSVERYS